MRAMKDGGVEWLGEVPAGWEVRYPKYLFAARKERARADDVMLTASQHHGMIPQRQFMEQETYTPVPVEKGHDILKHVEPGDFVISMRSFQGGLEYSSIRGKMSSAYLALRPIDSCIVDRYYRWLFKSQGYIQGLQTTTNLVRDGQALRYANFLRVWLPVPPLDEQRRIADFLDEKCAQIDRAITSAEQSIQEYLMLSRSFASDSISEMDCSRVGISQLTTKIGSGKTPKGGRETYSSTGVPFIRSQNVLDEGLSLKDVVYISEDVDSTMKSTHLLPNDLLLNITGASIGRSCTVPEDMGTANVNQHVCIIRPIESLLDSRFLHYCWYSDFGQRYVFSMQNGATREALNFKQIGAFKIPLPELSRQREIAAYLDARCSEIQSIAETKQAIIDELKAYKKSLIYEVVTGKREV